MFILKDDFAAYDNNRQPYTLEVEKHTYVENMHSAVHDKKFHLKSVGDRHILNTPAFETGHFETVFCLTLLKHVDPEFTLFFQYDKKNRCGLGLKIHYNLSQSLCVSLVKHEEHRISVIDEKSVDDFILLDSQPYPLSLDIKQNSVLLKIDNTELEFECRAQKGNLALERDNFIGEMILQNLLFETNDTFETETLLEDMTKEIPLVNGGNIPYRVTWKIDKINDEYYLSYVLDGGTATRECNRADRPGQFSVENDFMISPYVGVFNDDTLQNFDISSGELAFIDSNIYWECQRDVYKAVTLPLTGKFKLDTSLVKNGALAEDLQLIFGYKSLSCTGYANQAGGREFRYDKCGTLTYNGPVLKGQDVFEIFSPFDKFAMTLIPDDCYKREDVENHIKYNHYFEKNENIEFTLKLRTMLNVEYLDIRAEIVDIYESEILYSVQPDVSTAESLQGYSLVTAHAMFDKMDVGVYKVVYKVYYGTKFYKDFKCVFEVFDKDTDEIPALKSGLPFVFSMPNEIKWLERNAFDMWNPMPSCDGVHYISCVTDTPIEAERRKTWELTKPFKRKWFAWIAPRTCKDFGDINNHIETVRNVDYLFWANTVRGWSSNCQYTQFPLRSDHWTYVTTKSPFQQEILKEFLKENPDAAKVVNIDFEKEEFTNDHYERLMSFCRVEWISYLNERVVEILEEQNKQLEEINPSIKRSMYGPLNIYVTPTISYRSLQDFGLPSDHRLADSVFNGFAVFEDYPHACSYPTYRGPFSLATILLHCPTLTVYPEQYAGGGKGGSIDGAVKFANAPMGGYKTSFCENSTHAFEYVFNTAHLLEDGFHYWSTYGFHRRSHSTPMLDELAKSWKYALDNKPKRPLRSMAFIAQFDESDTVFEKTVTVDGAKMYAFCNQSELASGYVYECSRERGVPNGFCLKFDSLSSLSASDCDVLVVPTLKGAPLGAAEELRRLYNEGVNLIALSDVSGLEDIFGVKPCRTENRVTTLMYNQVAETIYATDAVFNYKSDGAEVLAYTDDETPAVFTTERTALINTQLLSLGRENTEQRENRPNVYCVVGTIIRKLIGDVVEKLSRPLAKGDNVGVTLFEACAGHTGLMVTNYKPYDNAERIDTEAVVRFDMENLADVESDREMFVCKKDGIVKEIRFNAQPNETVFAKLILKE